MDEQATPGEAVHLTAQADGGAPVDQVRTALNRLAGQLRASGLRPCDLRSMEWRASAPACFHLGRQEIDLAYREVFGGFRPPVRLRASGAALVVEAVAQAGNPSSDNEPVWRGYGLRELERQMSPRSGAPSMESVFKDKRERADAFRRGHAHAAYDIAYGDDPSETLDLFYPSQPAGCPLWVFIHGGYWQASDKRDVHDLARQMSNAGYAVATPNYALCPPSTLPRAVEQVKRSLRFLYEEAESLGIDAGRFNIAGTSAGGHLAAMMACDPELAFIGSALIVSGIHDLRPVSILPAGRILGLDARCVATLSPATLRPNPGVRVGMAVGERESEAFRAMSSELALAWSGRFLEVRGRSHFDVTDDLAGGGPLCDFALALANGGDAYLDPFL